MGNGGLPQRLWRKICKLQTSPLINLNEQWKRTILFQIIKIKFDERQVTNWSFIQNVNYRSQIPPSQFSFIFSINFIFIRLISILCDLWCTMNPIMKFFLTPSWRLTNEQTVKRFNWIFPEKVITLHHWIFYLTRVPCRSVGRMAGNLQLATF